MKEEENIERKIAYEELLEQQKKKRFYYYGEYVDKEEFEFLENTEWGSSK